MQDPIVCDDYSDPGCIVSDGFRLDELKEAAAGLTSFIWSAVEDKWNYDSSGGDDRPFFSCGGADG